MTYDVKVVAQPCGCEAITDEKDDMPFELIKGDVSWIDSCPHGNDYINVERISD